MAEEKKKKKAPKAPKWSTAFIWAGVQLGIAWYLLPNNQNLLPNPWSAALGSFIAGWCTAGVLATFARWGAGVYTMMVLGVVIGIAFSSGAVAAVQYVFQWLSSFLGLPAFLIGQRDNFIVDWEQLLGFLLSIAVIPPIALGLFTGVYVRSFVPANKKK